MVSNVGCQLVGPIVRGVLHRLDDRQEQLAGRFVVALCGPRYQIRIVDAAKSNRCIHPVRQSEIDRLGSGAQEPVTVRVKWPVKVDIARTNDPAAAITRFFKPTRQDDTNVTLLVSMPRKLRPTRPSLSSKRNRREGRYHVLDSPQTL